jgi:5-methylcytosine-specific restriction protein A
MVLKPSLEKNQEIDNTDLCSIFKCSPQGGMRRSHETNTLVLVSKQVKNLYRDRWKNGTLFYVGMGQIGDQRLDFKQNKTLAESQTNGVKVHLFEVLKIGKYTYRGEVKLVDEPKKEKDHLDIKGNKRLVWIFPLKIA